MKQFLILFFRKSLAIFVAIFMGIIIIKCWNHFYPNPQKNISTEHHNFYSNFDNSLVAKQDVSNAINNNQIVLFGSSEFSNQQFSSISNRFFNEPLKIPFLAFGHAGNQSFNYACEIAALKANKKSSSKMVFIISPGWFVGESGKGTSITSFLEFIGDDMLNKIMNDDSISENFKNSILNYVKRNFENINEPTPFIKYLFYQKMQSDNLINKLRYTPSTLLYNGWVQFEKTTTSRFDSPNNIFLQSKKIELFDMPNWDSLLQIGLQNETKKCTNEFGVNDEYYEKYAKGNLPRKIEAPTNPNQELEDLKLLVQLCKDETVDAFFIIQALNPYAYSNLEELNPMMSEVKKTITDAGFQAYDMWQPSKEKYQKGLLTDVMHTGEYGWYLINREIYNHYFQNK